MMAETDSNALDAGQYTYDAIRKYEAVYGRNFISPGGHATALAILSLIDMPPATSVLDVGCGLGGAAFLMAQTFGARVHGIDLSRNMLQIAHERCREARLTQAVTFEHADVLRYDTPVAYDLVHSREAIRQVEAEIQHLKSARRSIMVNLLQERCVACRRDAPHVTDDEVAELKPQIPDWKIAERDGVSRLERTYRFQNFVQALDFTNKVGALAEEEGHHPTLLTEWGKVTVMHWLQLLRSPSRQ